MNSQRNATQLKGGYSKWLADETLSSEIKVLQQKLGIVNTVAEDTAIVSSIVNCQQCINKDSQIENLRKNLKEMESKCKAEAEKVHWQQMGRFRNYRDSQTQEISRELQTLKKAYEQLKTKHSESPKTENGIKEVDSKELSKSGYRIQLLDEENIALKTKVEDLQRQLQYMQTSTTEPRKVTISSTNASQLTNTVPCSMLYRTNPSQRCEGLPSEKSVPSSAITNLPFIVSSPIGNSVQLNFSSHTPIVRKPTYEVKSNRTPTFKLMSDSKHNVKHNVESLSSRSPFQSHYYAEKSVPLHEHSFSVNRPLFAYQSGQCKDNAHPIASPFRSNNDIYEADCNKDMIEEKWRSLSHKIKVLQKENEKLKTKLLPLQH